MMKSEFEVRIGHAVTPEEYEMIEMVYMYHPIIKNANGKDTLVQVYKLGGMALITDMYGTALGCWGELETRKDQAKELCAEISALEAEVYNIEAHLSTLEETLSEKRVSLLRIREDIRRLTYGE